MNTVNLQNQLIKRVENVLPENYSLVDVLSELLEVSIDSAYRRIRGETALSINEVHRICDRFSISFDSLSGNSASGSVTFRYNPLRSENDFIDYLTTMLDQMEKIRDAGKKQLIYAAEDIPLFHHFRIPELATFKIFYWLKSIVSPEEFENFKYSREVVSGQMISLCEKIYNCYAEIPSIELWTPLTPSSLFMQIEYFWESGLFENKEEALHICSLAEEAFNIIEKQAELSQKVNFHGKPTGIKDSYLLYHSDIEIGNNCIFVTIEDLNLVYLTHNTLNKLSTSNTLFCEETDSWMKNIIKKSTLISGISEKQRYQFFRTIRSQLAKTTALIEKDS